MKGAVLLGRSRWRLIALALPLTVLGGGRAPEVPRETPAAGQNPLIPRLADLAGEADSSLVGYLRRGGCVIFFRHAGTNWAERDRAGEHFEDRAAQRNLSDAGRADAGAIGRAFRALGIPIDSVVANPMLRCRDTAALAFGAHSVSLDLYGRGPEYRRRRVAMLSTAPAAGANRVLVGQQDPMLPIIPGLHRDELKEGEALVIRPAGRGTFAVIARVAVADWARLTARYPAPLASPNAGPGAGARMAK